MNYINNPLPDPEDYSYEWTNSKLFVNEANYMKKQFYHIRYGPEEDNYKFLSVVEKIAMTPKQRVEYDIYCKLLSKNISQCGEKPSTYFSSPRELLDQNSKLVKMDSTKSQSSSACREILFSLFRSKDDNLI